MGSVGTKSTSRTKVAELVSRLSEYDQRFSDDLVKASQELHDEFPELEEIYTVRPSDELGYETLASMNGLGFLDINRRVLENYDAIKRELESKTYWLAGTPDFEHSIANHELAHNADRAFMRFMSSHAPNGSDFDEQTVGHANWAEIYSEALGKKYNVGDIVKTPTTDYNKPFIDMDGKKYSLHDFDNGVSSVVVPLAMKNIRDNWKALGYDYQPTEYQITHDLSGYAGKAYNTGVNRNEEIFAESYANYKSYGDKGNVLAREVMRLTKQAYKSAGKQPMNDMWAMWTRINDIRERRKKEREAKKNAE